MSAQRPAVEALPGHRLPSGPYRVCLVCLGNICRSPMAEVVLREELARAGLAEAVTVESAGTGDWHVGERIYGPAGAELTRHGSLDRPEALRQMTQRYIEHMHTNEPVHTWPPLS